MNRRWWGWVSAVAVFFLVWADTAEGQRGRRGRKARKVGAARTLPPPPVAKAHKKRAAAQKATRKPRGRIPELRRLLEDGLTADRAHELESVLQNGLASPKSRSPADSGRRRALPISDVARDFITDWSSTADPEAVIKLRDLRRWFAEMDRGGDEAISFLELRETSGAPLELHVALDENADGSLSFVEFAAPLVLELERQEAPMPPELIGSFQELAPAASHSAALGDSSTPTRTPRGIHAQFVVARAAELLGIGIPQGVEPEPEPQPTRAAPQSPPANGRRPGRRSQRQPAPAAIDPVAAARATEVAEDRYPWSPPAGSGRGWGEGANSPGER